ncbi:hypothetical protein B0T14DRAFT_90374 [Immersiella caudata]|uniref:Uncharacterized protein n=1 Tax=Immersiella caudata TaxID=314043 RepID=A0AA39X2D8_9PEZI|nr:hypothetical protein B0T14DRAFT_90374 [Immersiella caudata]
MQRSQARQRNLRSTASTSTPWPGERCQPCWMSADGNSPALRARTTPPSADQSLGAGPLHATQVSVAPLVGHQVLWSAPLELIASESVVVLQAGWAQLRTLCGAERGPRRRRYESSMHKRRGGNPTQNPPA